MIAKKFYLITFGCRLNQAESRMIGEGLVRLGFMPVSDFTQADIVVLNSCSVTQKAEKEVRQAIRKIKRTKPDCFLIVTGCVHKIKNQIDILVNNRDKLKIAKILQKKLMSKPFSHTVKFYKDKYSRSKKALIKIQDGCDKFCTYCLVPFMRGRAHWRAINEVIKEINQKIEQGIEEVILTGVNLTGISKIIKAVLQKTKIKKISFGSLNLEAINEEFLKLYKDRNNKQRLTNHFHIPIQSFCDQTLKRMGRKYKTKDIFSVIGKLDKAVPSFTFSTDIIVGFPGETKEEFLTCYDNLLLIKKLLKARFLKIHSFRFSPRTGTTAANMEGKKGWEKIEERIKKERAEKISQIAQSNPLHRTTGY